MLFEWHPRYAASWKVAVESEPAAISITSFNEWGEGTQIEPAVPALDPASGLAYADYGPDPNLYLKLTKAWADEFKLRLAANKRSLAPAGAAVAATLGEDTGIDAPAESSAGQESAAAATESPTGGLDAESALSAGAHRPTAAAESSDQILLPAQNEQLIIAATAGTAGDTRQEL